jgi:hypothetical protein
LRSVTVWVWLLLSLLPILLVSTIATFPGELLDEVLPSWSFVPTSWTWTRIGLPWPLEFLMTGKAAVVWRPTEWDSPHALLVGGVLNDVTQRPRSLWSNRLVLQGIDILDRSKVDIEKKIPSPPAVSLRGRHLEGAVLFDATLRKGDFTGAYVKGARLDRADLREAKLGCAYDGRDNQCTDLRGVRLDYAQLQGANLRGAQLQGAVLNKARLEGDDLVGAQLQSAELFDVHLQGANLSCARLQGGLLARAQLQGAVLDNAQLQGVSLKGAKLQAASLDHVFVWRADANDIAAEGARVTNIETAPTQAGCPSPVMQWTAKDFADLKQLIETVIPSPGFQRTLALRRIAQLDPDPEMKSEWQPDAWIRLERLQPPKEYEKTLAAGLRQIGCAAEGAPYVIRGFLRASFDKRFTADPAQAAAVAQYFLDDARCPGARGLLDEDKAALEEIQRSDAPAKP